MSRQITIRGVSDELAGRLKELARQRGQSMNALAIELLERAVGVDERRRQLLRHATWTAEDKAEFDGYLAEQRLVREEDWG